MQMVALQICTCSNGIKVRITKAYCKISVMAVFMRKNEPFVPHIGSLSLCCWIILGHIGRRGLESREDDISLSAWVSGLRGRFQKGRKCLCMYLFLLWNILANQDFVFMNAEDEWMLFLCSDDSHLCQTYGESIFIRLALLFLYCESDNLLTVDIKCIWRVYCMF